MDTGAPAGLNNHALADGIFPLLGAAEEPLDPSELVGGYTTFTNSSSLKVDPNSCQRILDMINGATPQ